MKVPESSHMIRSAHPLCFSWYGLCQLAAKEGWRPASFCIPGETDNTKIDPSDRHITHTPYHVACSCAGSLTVKQLQSKWTPSETSKSDQLLIHC